MAIPKPTPAPAPTPVAPAPTTKAVGPEALRQEYIDKTAEVRLNKDKSRTPKQIEERIAELKAEYQKLKAEMTAPKPKAKAEAKPAPVKVVSKKVQEEIKALEDEIAYHEGKVDEAIEEIGNTSYNLKEAIAEAKKESAELKGKKMSKEERQEAKDDIEIKLQQARDEHDSYMEQYKDQKSESSKAKKQAEAKLAKLKAKQEQAPVSVVEEEVPSYDEVKDLDPTDETALEKLLAFLDRTDASLSEFGRDNLSMGMAVPLAKAIVKSLKVLVKTGITLQEAIKRVAAERNIEEKEILDAIVELDKRQRPMTKLRDQIKAEVQAAASTKKDLNQKRKDLSDLIKNMEVTGTISAAKAKAILNKIGRVNLDNPAAVDDFVNYVTNVFEDAEYVENLKEINSKLARAKKNVASKIGMAKLNRDSYAENLGPLLNRLFSINPKMIPAEVFETYSKLVDMFGASGAVLSLDNINNVARDINEVLDFIDNQISLIPELADKLFNYKKAVLTEDGALDYAATIEKMLADDTITEDEYKLMKKYKSSIMPKAQAIPKTEKELADEKDELLNQIKSTAVSTSQLGSKDEIRAAAELIKLAKSPIAKMLSNRELANLLKVLDNINNGYYPHIANTLYESLEQYKNAVPLSRSVLKAKIPTLAEFTKKYKLQASKRKSIFSSIKNIPLFNIDEIFGDFKTKDMFNSIFNALAQNQQRYRIEIEKINQKLEKAYESVLEHYKNSPNAAKEAEMKMAVYRIQREFNTNPGDKRVNSAAAYLQATIKASKDGDTMYDDKDIEIMENILEKYGVKDKDGEVIDINADKLYNSFVPVEKKALDVLDEVNKSIEDKALFTADVIRGNKIYLLNNYNHLNVLSGKSKAPDTISDMVNKFNQKEITSTKAKSLIERTQGAKPVSLNVFTTVQRGANSVLMDYYLTSPVRIARGTINKSKEIIKSDKKLTQDKEDVLNALNDALELSLKSMLDANAVSDNFVDSVIKELAKAGYRSMLAGIPRSATELTSNMAYVLAVAGKEFNKGVELRGIVMSPEAVDIMEAVGSKVISRVYGDATLSGRLVDPSILSKKVGIGNTTIKSPVGNAVAIIHNATTKKLKNSVEYVADGLITTPDKIMMRPLWFGSFSNAFKDITGVDLTEADFKKIADQDVGFMVKYKDAIETAGRIADEKVAMAGNVDNPFMNSLRSYIPSDASTTTKAFKVFDNFMNRFTIGEFLTARKGIMSMMGNGSLSRKEGARLLAAVIARMTVYTVMGKMLQEFMYGLITGEDDEEDDKSFAQKLGQGLASTLTTLIFGRDFGNTARTAINYGVEKVNENYLDFLREGDYDPYQDAIQYNFLEPKEGKPMEAIDVITAVSGPYSPALKSFNLVLKKTTEPEKKEAAAIERQQREKYERLPLEIFGNLGYVPLYKDIRNMLNKSIYKGLKKELEGTKEEEYKPFGLGREDLKRYYPEIYEQYYGEGTQADAERELKEQQEELERRIKDEYYQYTPKEKVERRKGISRERKMRR